MLKPTLIMLCGALALASCQKDDSSLSDAQKPFKKDVTAPEVRITSPTHEGGVWDTQLTVDLSDDMGLASLDIYQDGVWLTGVTMPSNGKAVTRHTFSAFYNIGMPDIRFLKAVATDRAGNKAEHQITIYKVVLCPLP